MTKTHQGETAKKHYTQFLLDLSPARRLGDGNDVDGLVGVAPDEGGQLGGQLLPKGGSADRRAPGTGTGQKEEEGQVHLGENHPWDARFFSAARHGRLTVLTISNETDGRNYCTCSVHIIGLSTTQWIW